MTPEVAKAILRWEDHEDVDHFAEVTGEQIHDTSRWHTHYSAVYQDKRDETFWEVSWSRGSTEIQDEGPENIDVYQVWPHKVETVVYTRTPPEPTE
ncbi:hypothetical protein [Brucella intermedia]|uniref:hypothetical protein n=1 Tax=Brucella intermedia TaxID=94625 RepID=UPI00224B52B6|nr:hypothetical protein [Brucella intermedia]